MNRICVNCGRGFEPLPHIPRQSFCSHPACQKARKRAWQRNKLRADPDYRHNQRAAQKAWQERNRDYWHEYHLSHRASPKVLRAGNTQDLHKSPLKKMDLWALRHGFFEVCARSQSPGNPGTPWIVEIISVRKISPARWTCKERT